jgi:RNA ligase (TIGR02306 family)
LNEKTKETQMTRQLATIQRITNLTPIDGADRIETARVLGWDVVVTKGDFKVGELAIFYEIDSFLPATDERYTSFSDKFITWQDKRGMRLKTIRLRKQISQGLLLPISKFPEIKNGLVIEGFDVTEILKIEKWEAAEPNGPGVPNTGKTRVFPSFVRKTDQERVQNYGSRVLEHLDTRFQVTTKKDGSSMTTYVVRPNCKYYAEAKKLRGGNKKLSLFARFKNFFNETFGFATEAQPIIGLCSRNVQLDLDGSGNFHTAFKSAKLEQALLGISEEFDRSIAIQGELVAPTIQGNYEKVTDVEFHVFGMYDIQKQREVSPNRVEEICQQFGLKHVTVLFRGTLKDILNLPEYNKETIVQAILDLAEGEGDNKGVKREGVVFKAEGLETFTFKAISNSYLLKTGK